MFISGTQQTQSYIACIFGLFNAIIFCGCPNEPSSVRAWIHKKSKWERPFLTNSAYKVVAKNCNYYSENGIIGKMKLKYILHK
jgi:hypothetical protein